MVCRIPSEQINSPTDVRPSSKDLLGLGAVYLALPSPLLMRNVAGLGNRYNQRPQAISKNVKTAGAIRHPGPIIV